MARDEKADVDQEDGETERIEQETLRSDQELPVPDEEENHIDRYSLDYSYGTDRATPNRGTGGKDPAGGEGQRGAAQRSDSV